MTIGDKLGPYEILAPIVGVVVPGGFDGGIGDAEGFHELHVEVGGEVELGGGVERDGVGLGGGERGGGGGQGEEVSARDHRVSLAQ